MVEKAFTISPNDLSWSSPIKDGACKKGALIQHTYLLSLLMVCFGCVTAQGQSKISTNLTPQLQLTTEIIDARFCESDYLRLQLRLRYFNSGDQPIILYRQSTTIMTYFISKTFERAEQEKYEQKYSPMQRALGPLEHVDSEKPDERTFVILQPATSYETSTHAHFPFIFDGKSKDSNLLRPGRHILQIRVRTWPEQQDTSLSLRERWRAHGYLWTSSVVSRPMTFSIDKHPNVVGCSTCGGEHNIRTDVVYCSISFPYPA